MTRLMTALASVLVLALCGSARADIIDQQQLQDNGNRSVKYYAPCGQEFLPAYPDHVGVELKLQRSGSYPLVVRVRRDTITGQIVAQTSMTITTGWNYFPLVFTAVPESRYVIEVACDDRDNHQWHEGDYTSYTRGRAIRSGVPESNTDFCFKTWVRLSTGACCLEHDECIDDLTESECEDIDGLYMGDETDCATSFCGGACCLETGVCLLTSESNCAERGGVYQGLGTDCAIPWLCSGACCLYRDCVDQTIEFSCDALGGTFMGSQTLCALVECPDRWFEPFDRYATDVPVTDQSDWEPWDDNPAVRFAYASTDQARSAPNSAELDGNDDIVHRYSEHTSGIWEYTAWVYVPPAMDDIQAFVLLNTYPASQTRHWSLQLELDGGRSLIADVDGPATLPLAKGTWSEIKVIIDLDEDRQWVFCDNKFLLTKSWTAGVAPGGALNIGAVDLWAAGSTLPIYYDDMELVERGPDAPPLNDTCSAAIPIVDGPRAFSTLFAGTDGPPHAQCGFSGDDQIESDIWYTYVASCEGRLTVSTCNGADFDSRLAIYAGTDCGDLENALLACNDDAPGCDLTSRLAIDVSPGSTYLLRVGGWGTEQGTGVVTLTCDPCPTDIDDSGGVGFGDILAILAAWGPCPGCPEDLNDDGAVTFDDLLALLGTWGPCP